MFTTSIVRQQRFTFASQLALSCLAAIATLLFTAPAHAYQPEMDPVVLSVPDSCVPAQNCRLVLVGATLGSSWAGNDFDYLAPDFYPTETWQELNITREVYVEWIFDSSQDSIPQHITPTPLDSYDWFDGWENSFQTFVSEDLSDTGPYHNCPATAGIEAPVHEDYGSITSSGHLTLQDIHGGVNHLVSLWFQRVQWVDGCPSYYIVIIGFGPPQTYRDYSNNDVDATPATTVTLNRQIDWQYDIYSIPVPYRIVEQPSSDVAYASRRQVDAADLAAIGGELGNSVTYGYGNPPGDSNWHTNIHPFGTSRSAIDANDLSAYAVDVADTLENCLDGIPKAGMSEGAAILAWFGLARTGNLIVIGPNGEQAPEYAVADWDKFRHAIEDPYGYRDLIQAQPPVPWGRVKSLYRD